MTAEFTLERAGRSRIHVHGRMDATVTRICVVSLDPFETEVSEPIDVTFAPEAEARAAEARAAADQEVRGPAPIEGPPDPIIEGRIDLGALAAEFLALGLDPYPRKPGVDFAAPADASAPRFALRRPRPARAAGQVAGRVSASRRLCKGEPGYGQELRLGRKSLLSGHLGRSLRLHPAGHVRRLSAYQGAPIPMPKPVRIALDAMGGDHGPGVVVSGAALALEKHSQVAFLIYGEEALVRPLIEASPKLAAHTTFVHTSVAVKMGDKPSQALRAGRRTSSMWLAIDAVKRGEADVAVSAGNTGALMAMAKFCLHTMALIDRPAIAAVWPTIRGETVVLDVGATIGADARHLVDLAIMGAAMATVLFDLERPTVGLLNIGVEEIKGNEGVKAAARLLREMALPTLTYHGFVEGDDIGKGTVDVVVTEGFTGNIALKTAEGTARQIGLLSARGDEP